MSPAIFPMELVVFSVMAVWFVGHLLYTLPFPSLRRRLEGLNHGLWFANWSVFGAGDERAEITSYTLEFRDNDGNWQQVVQGRPWRWRAFLWQPERRIADRLHRLAHGIARTPDLVVPAAQFELKRRRRLLAHFVATHCPRAVGTKREIRFRMQRTLVVDGSSSGLTDESATVEEQILLAFVVEANDR